MPNSPLKPIACAALLLAAQASFIRAETAPPAQASVTVSDRYGTPMREYLNGRETYCEPVPLDRISPWLILATVAVEDKRFFEHSGVDFKAALRALWQNTSSGTRVSGASTITQQLVRALEPRERSLWGKMKEMWGARRMEKDLSKREILENYFNRVPYSNMMLGAQTAARAYFNCNAEDLSLAQAALLAGIPKSPRKYNPVLHPKNAFDRQKLALRRMLDLGYINDQLYNFALNEKPVIRKPARPFQAPQFCDMARAANPALTAIRSTIDGDIQSNFEKILSADLQRLRGNRVTNGSIIAIDNASGDILAWVGSADFSDEENAGQIDGVTALRQPGSALKPFLYALAMEKNLLRASDLLDDSPAFFEKGFSPRNYDEHYHGKVRAREALACSYNIPAVRVAEKTGVPAFLNRLRKLGFDSLSAEPERYGLGLALGNGEVRLLELANAYATLARGGLWRPARYLKDAPPEGGQRRVFEQTAAYIVTDILSDNQARAKAFTLNSPFSLPFPFAAKTGTSKDYRDNWAAGYTPRWTIAVWVGNFNGQSMRKVSGISGAGPVLHDAAVYMESRYPSGAFSEPKGLVRAEICPESGLLPSPWCPGTITEVFKKGRMPAKKCALHSPGKEPAPANNAPAAAIAFPARGDVFRIDPSTPREAQAIRFRAARENAEGLRWFVDGKENEGEWWRLAPGRHRLYFTRAVGGKTVKSEVLAFLVVE